MIKKSLILISLLVIGITILSFSSKLVTSIESSYIQGESFNMYFIENDILYIGDLSKGLLEFDFDNTFNSSNCELSLTSKGGYLIFDNNNDVELSIEIDVNTVSYAENEDAFYMSVSVPIGSDANRIDNYKYDLDIPSGSNNYIYWVFSFYYIPPEFDFWFMKYIIAFVIIIIVIAFAIYVKKWR